MMKRIQAYFQNEDQAEGVRAKLQALRADNVLVEPIPEDNHEMTDVLQGVFSPREEGSNHERQVLTADVSEEDYDRVRLIIKESNGHLEE
ncbi:hypothetical protein SAMN05421743_108175 [Thalassobacillus cyri]|uniref:Uncharacterized protein n=1 Tax=Thalassobacillus cyri TaxID=571932 RepID=A0A1H4E8C8_9BACI|nr:hypothetical protein [Thalassobacillus cyri]SEA81087.1 hypothetical protein SAMN05421743_108175 [Thalassobacillus cyri]